MVDPVIPEINQPSEQEALSAAKNGLKSMISQIEPMLTKLYSEQGAASAISFVNSLTTNLKEKIVGATGSVSFNQLIDTNLDTKSVSNMMTNLKAAIEKGMSSIDMGLDIDTKPLKDSLGGIADQLLNIQAVGEMGLFTALSKEADLLTNNPMMKGLKEMEAIALRIDNMGLDAFGNRLNPASIDGTINSLEKLNMVYRTQLSSMAELGFSTKESETGMKGLADTANLSLSEIQSLSAGTADLTGKLEGMAGFQRIVSATGIDAGAAQSVLALQMRSLGVDAGGALAVFDTLNKVQQNTSLSITDVAKNVTTAATNFKYYGNNIDGVATMYKNLIAGLGTGKEALAADVFSKVTAGIAGMSTEMRAFIGMTTQMGGGGGALESALQIEEAISSGEGLQDVMDSIYDRVEQMSGTQLLTRKEAIDTGQSQQYMVQRKLLGQMTNVNDDQAIEKMVVARKSGNQMSIDQLRPSSDFGGMMNGQAESNLNQKMGPLARMSAKATATAEIEGSEAISKRLRTIGQGLQPAGDVLIKAIRGVSTKILDLTSKGMTMSQAKDQLRSKGTVEKELTKEKGEAFKVSEGTATVVNMGNLMNTLGGPLESLATTAGVIANTGTETTKYYTTITDLHKKGNDTLENLLKIQTPTKGGGGITARDPLPTPSSRPAELKVRTKDAVDAAVTAAADRDELKTTDGSKNRDKSNKATEVPIKFIITTDVDGQIKVSTDPASVTISHAVQY